MRNAIQIEGQLLSVEFVKPGRRNSQTNASFLYDFDGRTYQSNRIALFKKTASFYQPLKADLERNAPVLVWVDPDNPERAFLDREFVLRPFVGGLIFSIGWASIGLYPIRYIRKRRRAEFTS